ncbi:MAG TPA: GDSL-type esterase/lipase family protein [Polyangiaceae bacterium]|nr:GDSL-type esterase/lipase family protein [Polyangiaceae bacterium]
MPEPLPRGYPHAAAAPVPASSSASEMHTVVVERSAFGRVFGVLLGLATMIGATYVVPPLASLRPWTPDGEYVPFWNVIGREILKEGERLEAEAMELAKLREATAMMPTRVHEPPKPQPEPTSAPEPVFPPYSPEAPVKRPKHGIEPPEALDSYFRKLTLADMGVPGAIARAGHWGDSVIGVDGITSGIRRRLQARFGDAGHGFHMMDRYHPSYRQQNIEFKPGRGWNRCLIINNCSRKDGRYGYGGLIAQTTTSADAWWGAPEEGFGSTISVFELWFARQENGGTVDIVIDGQEKITVDTRGAHLEDAWHMVYMPPGRHHFTVRAKGNVRAYGVVLENDGPGVVWDGMSHIGGSPRGLRLHDPEHIKSQIRHRDLDLVVFMYGGNDLFRASELRRSMEPYYKEYGEVLEKFRAAKPDLACLVMSVTDHGERAPDGTIVSRKFTKVLANAQREVARRHGCAFFDTYEAMGGEGTVARWFRARPRLMYHDLGHPTGAGHEVIAGLFTNALLHAYEEYRTRMAGQPLPELTERRRAAEAFSEPKEPPAPGAQNATGDEPGGAATTGRNP